MEKQHKTIKEAEQLAPGAVELPIAEILTPEEVNKTEWEMRDAVNGFRKEQSLNKLVSRIVLSHAAGIHTRYLSTQQSPQATHVTPRAYIQEHHKQAADAMGIIGDARSMARAAIASWEVQNEPRDSNINYAQRGGVSEVVVIGTTDAQAALDALLNSVPHRRALSDAGYKDMGVSLTQNENGVPAIAITLGRALDERFWNIDARDKINLPIIQNR